FRELAPLKRALSLFEAPIDGRLSYFQAQLRFEFPARDRLTSFVAVRVDAEKLRSDFFPAFIASKMKAVEGPTGFPPLSVSVIDGVLALGVFFVVRAAAREVKVAELRSNFVSSVSHDLKTPLALIQLFAETLELGRLKNTDRAHEYYRIINSEARKLTRLIDNLLDFSK